MSSPGDYYEARDAEARSIREQLKALEARNELEFHNNPAGDRSGLLNQIHRLRIRLRQVEYVGD